MKLDKFWMVFKETAIPAVIGIVVLISSKTKWSLTKLLLNQVLDLKRVRDNFVEKGLEQKFEKIFNLSNIFLGITFFISALLNCLLAQAVIEGEPGSQKFAESLAKMLQYSFPLIALPMCLILGIIFYFVFKSIQKQY